LELSEKLVSVSQESYKKTLQKFHPWVVQKAALLAMHMLPTKQVSGVGRLGDQISQSHVSWNFFSKACT
jgi:hypothetical protein